MKFKINPKIKTLLKILFISVVIIFVSKEFMNIKRDFNTQYFITYKNELNLYNLFIIGILGIVSYLPLSLYDFILKKKIGINLNYRKLYKYSWIASSLSNLLGFGGATSLAFKQYFYNDYVEDHKKLFKEIGKIVMLNMTGLSIICLVYIFWGFDKLIGLGVLQYVIVLISLYAPVTIGMLVYRYIKDKNIVELISTLAIIAISFLEWVTTILLIYVVLRITGINTGVFEALSIYLEAAVVGIVSLIPGGVGTFDLTFINGLKEFGVAVEKTTLVIILYRVSYYIVPAAIGVTLFIQDFGKKINKKFNGIPKQIFSNLAYKILIVLVFLAGVTVIAYSIAPDFINSFKIFRGLIHKGARTRLYISSNVSVGFMIILLSLMLKYKSKTIYKVTISLLLFGSIVLFTSGASIGKIIFLILVSSIIYLSKDMFYRESFVTNWKNIIIDIVVLGASFVFYFEAISIYRNYVVLPNFLYRIGFYCLIIIIVIYLAIKFFNRDMKIPVMLYSHYKEEVDNIINSYTGTSLTHLIYLEDKYIYMNEDRDVLFQYEVYKDKLFVLGNPVGNKEKIFREIESFYEFADKYGYTPIYYQVDEDMISYLHSNGYNFMKLGEEAKVDVQEFNIVGNKMKSLRSSRNKIVKEGYTFEMIYPPFSDELLKKLKDISDEWLGDRQEKGYSVGFFDKEYLNKAPIAIVKSPEDEIKAFANIMNMYDNNQSFSVDLMRFTHNAPRGMMDYIFINLIELGKEKNYKIFNMGVAPLANVGTSKYAFLSEKIALQIYEYGQALYSFKGLRQYKEKYANNWSDKYIAYRKEVSLPITMLQAALLCARVKRDDDYTILDRMRDFILKLNK